MIGEGKRLRQAAANRWPSMRPSSPVMSSYGSRKPKPKNIVIVTVDTQSGEALCRNDTEETNALHTQ